jgi:hypothetical protein
MASAIVAIGSALFVNRATSKETEKKITTVNDASALPKNPGAPRKKIDTTIEITLSANAGMRAPRHIALVDDLFASGISIKLLLSIPFL